jgi:hypothetical protein
MTEILIISYFVVTTLVGIWAVGVQHAYEKHEFPMLNSTPDYTNFFFAYLFFPVLLFVQWKFYSGYGWMWPKKGVTYQ